MTNEQKRELRKRLGNQPMVNMGYHYGQTVDILARFMLENEDTKAEIKAFIDNLQPYLDNSPPYPTVMVEPNSVYKIIIG